MSRWLWLPFAALLLAGCLRQTLPLSTQSLSAPTAQYLLCVRQGGRQPDVLVMATLGLQGAEFRDLCSGDNLGMFLEALGVFGGRAYFAKIDDLLCVALDTGKCTRIANARPYAYVDGRFFCVRGKEMREYDLRARRVRTLVVLPEEVYIDALAVSPDGRWLAYFVDPSHPSCSSARRLTIVDTERRTVQPVATNTEYRVSAAASIWPVAPPHAWLGARFCFLRSDITGDPADGGGHSVNDPVAYTIAEYDVATGQVRDIVALGSAMSQGWPTLGPARPGLPPTLDVRTGPGAGTYLVDVDAGRLVATDSAGGAFRVVPGPTGSRLCDGAKLLGSGPIQMRMAVSPDQKAVVWANDFPDTADQRGLWLYHHGDHAARLVAQGWFGECFLWFGDADLAPTEPSPPAAAEWRAFDSEPFRRATPTGAAGAKQTGGAA